ncbi:MAG: dUTP diphosphatase [Ruminococcaceae bacterium]|nr:dUTP diphosphatase [Oscillospiraceae bacterium]
MEVNKLYIKKVNENAVIPKYMTEGSAAMDICACLDGDIVIAPGKAVLVPSGLAVMIERGFAGMLYARSGLAAKNGITLANCVGVIDSDYRGEILVALINLSDKDFTVTHGMRIAQLVITPVCVPTIIVTDALENTARGEGGFGSTGVK